MLARRYSVTERRKSKRNGDRRHPLRSVARLRAAGPALEQRKTPRDRSRITVQLPADVVDRLRNAVYWTPGLTVTGFLSRCIVETINRMESERGDVFPSRTTELRPGRPRK